MFRSSPASPPRRLRVLAVLSLFTATAAFSATAALAAPGYQLDSVKSSFSLGGEVPHGVAVDQASQMVYVTVLTTNAASGAPGRIEQFNASGVPTANSPFTTGGSGDFFTGVAVNPVTQGIYAYQTSLNTPFGPIGTPKMNLFSSTGTPGTSFSVTRAAVTQLAADSTGRVYYPNEATDTVQVFDSSGALKTTISCTGCAGGAFSNPASVAVDSSDNVYVVDVGLGRVTKFVPSGGGSLAYSSVLQSGRGAVAVAVDPSNDDVLVGDQEGSNFHIVAYDSSGDQFDDFGAGIVGAPEFGPESAAQIAANATTHKLYVTDPIADKVWLFERVATIPAPTATTNPASSLGQLGATLNATVNANGHALTDCHFEYTDHADFLTNEYANADSAPCPSKPSGTSAAQLSATITGLAPGTAYDYRIAATSDAGTTNGSNQAFTTLAANPPTVTTGSASALEQAKATIAGTVNPLGGTISDCHFEYTNHADFLANEYAKAKTAPCLPAKPSGTSATPVSAKIAGLTPGTAYDYRIVATSNAGTSKGGNQAFTTLAETCATNPALCPPAPPTPPVPPAPTPPATPPVGSPASKPLKCKKGFKKKRVKGKLKCVKVKRHRQR